MNSIVGVLLLTLAASLNAAPKVGLIEGDIVMDRDTMRVISGTATGYEAKTSKMWPKATIPYTFHYKFPYARRRLIQQAIYEYSRKSCVRFVPRNNEYNYVVFVDKDGCFSSVGRQGGAQDISISSGCERPGTILHEMMHAIGFYHEQSRLDRDNYITIYWNNIMSGTRSNFEKHGRGEADNLGLPYDLDSVMHYDNYAFAINRKYKTIEVRGDRNRKLGQRKGFSTIDVKQINELYCSGKHTTGGCADKDKSCAFFAKDGKCNDPKIEWYMKGNCEKSCNFC